MLLNLLFVVFSEEQHKLKTYVLYISSSINELMEQKKTNTFIVDYIKMWPNGEIGYIGVRQ